MLRAPLLKGQRVYFWPLRLKRPLAAAAAAAGDTHATCGGTAKKNHVC